MLRMTLGCATVLAACAGLSADDKKVEQIDPAKLVGRWEPKEEAAFIIEFTKDGRVKLTTTTADGKEKKGEGTYKLEGNKLTATVKLGDQERTLASTVSKLTDAELVGTNDKGRVKTLVRVPDKRPK